MNYPKRLLVVLSMVVLLSSLAASSFALGPGQYGFAAYSGDKLIEEVRIFDYDNGKPYKYSCAGKTFYYGDYSDDKITDWTANGYDIYIVFSTSSGYNPICQLND